MEFYTQVSIPSAGFLFSYADEILLLGSCFAGEMGRRLGEDRFRVTSNPFGLLYNPLSMARSLQRMLHPEPFTLDDLHPYEGLYHSFAHHGSFSSPSPREALSGMNRELAVAAECMGRISRLILTFGTAWVYRLRDTGEAVANCHKLPERFFLRERLDVEEVTGLWDAVLQTLWKARPDTRVVLTVSPVRHWKETAQGNQLSKAVLLLAADRLQKRYPEQIAYFPAYEILMDELRDYRFYAADMLHPSPQAADYITGQFYRAFLDAESHKTLAEWRGIQKDLSHLPLHPATEAYRKFVVQTLLKVKTFSGKFPYFDLSRETNLLQSKLK
ncbi:MAG: GSCFA domain-containing protein [Tannerellaceae bacterium]|jgi:hypothetical protein|nr:GSCFA domain-containing protein [Tannerellaceae bacterium]